MGTTTELRQEVKLRFVPFMAERGFLLDMRDAPVFFLFRRTIANTIYLCDIQWDKYGKPRFRLLFGQCTPEGVVGADGKRIPANAMIASWCTPRGLLKPKSTDGINAWFRQDRPWWQRLFTPRKLYPASGVVDNLITRFAEIESYWKSGQTGPHIMLWNR